MSTVKLNQAGDLTYSPRDVQHDEVMGTDGQVKDHWKYLLDGLHSLGPETLADRHVKAQRILRDDGATYKIYDHEGDPNTWHLDLVPSLLESEEWASIEAGLLERAELFNVLLKDIYGPRNLIHQGVIPPEALFAHRGFLRACQGVQLPGEQQIILHAVDLLRTSGNQLCVLTDRTQSPSGAGYALENRTVMSRVLPSLFRDSHVHRLASFFQHLRNKLSSLAPNQDQPRIVVLTPGAQNEAYFEHAYIANYLGFHLVQSDDLVVRNGYVWMKSLDGLNRVDVILRRVDDSFCDPVELRSNSLLGIANLLESVRSGRVVIANPLGAGVLENPIFLKYLPGIAKALLGRELRLKSVPTFWCGDKDDMAYVLDNLDSLVIKPIFRANTTSSVIGGSLTQAQQKSLLDRIKTDPLRFVAQPVLHASQLPTFFDDRLEARPALLRTFAVAGNDGYRIMPGGLTRVGVEQSSFVISNQAGSQSKDTWVLASEPERITTLQDSSENYTLKDLDLIGLPSRVVENLFWMGRYAERAEASLRMLRTIFMVLNGEDLVPDTSRRFLLQAATRVSCTLPGFINCSDDMILAPEEELFLIVNDGNRAGSVRSTLNSLLACADESKELLSSDMLRVINDLRDGLSALDNEFASDIMTAPEESLDPLVTALLALSGLAKESMVRDLGWRFMDIGRRIERGLQSANLMKCLLISEVPEADQKILIDSLLLSLEVLISYRRRYRERMGVQSCLDLVLLDTSNPRSLLYQFDLLSEHFRELPKSAEAGHELPPHERAVLDGEGIIKLSRLEALSQCTDGTRKELSDSLQQIENILGSISNAITAKYFDHRESSQQLVNSNWENS